MKKQIATLGIAGTLVFGASGVAVDRAVNPYEDKATHYELSIKSDIQQGERVEISKTKAEMTLKGWNDEYAIKIIPQVPTQAGVFGATRKDFDTPADRPLLSKKMEYKSGDVTAFIEPKTENEFDIDFTLDSKPDTNVFTYIVEGADEFDFFYQPPLTQEEIDEGATRPENIVGSYAVYHKTKANNCTNCGTPNYATGKIFHIYRPKAIDTNGKEEWAVLNYSAGILSVTVPQNFLDSANYPVVVDPTFGTTAIGGTNIPTTLLSYTKQSAGVDGDVTSLSFYGKNSGANTNMGVAIYSDSAGAPNSKLAEDTGDVTLTSTAQWWGLNISYTVTSGSSSYWLAYWGNAAANAVTYYYDTTSGNLRTTDTSSPTWQTWPATATVTTYGARLTSLYATYTASGGSTPIDNDSGAWFQLFE